MSSTFKPEHPDQFHSPEWDSEANRPVVDNKYHDPKTGKLRPSSGDTYSGPPAVDIIVLSIHAETAGCVLRAQQPFPVEKLLAQVVKVVSDRKLGIDSLSVTKYAIRVVLSHDLSKNEFDEVSKEMVFGLWTQV